MNSTESNAPPAAATDAVLVVSEEMPEGAQKVQELDFDDLDGDITADDLLRGMRYMGFQATSLADAIRIINDMGALRRISSSVWATHTCLPFSESGAGLRKKGLNRIGNLVVPNSNYREFEDWVVPIFDKMLEEQEASKGSEEEISWTPSKMINRLGKEINDERSVYYWAWKNDIPVFCPALTDGSLGDMLYFHTFKTSPQQLKCDIVEDIRKINTISVRAKRAGMIILGGGVIKHHIANACLMRNGAESAVYINTGQEFDGSDAGARPDEAVSWGKIKVGADAVKHLFLASRSSGFYIAPASARNPIQTLSPPAGTSHDFGPRLLLSDYMLSREAKRSLRKTFFAALNQPAITALNVLRRIDSK
ncbi:deoxyhypusine synthase [Verticillium alfalfae VaMs.102]|uniref:deoxyhypusine synthase n=1 Tax=Verticillium alfalfae (strain VaMs.102 / ATCC MYA-4576 / FGSC 10136) TaxID=526221 RepID=C9SKQ0_VERA1|nr:deoxyhypusine synthase [Verticillium alfalfae VaMs.102]EEY19268.1 deoxyhypusine synthase [Verticillium alfalfae VaMs.102]